MKLTYAICALGLLVSTACERGAIDYVPVLGPTSTRTANSAEALLRSEGIDAGYESKVGLITVFVPEYHRARAERILREAGLLRNGATGSGPR